MEHPDDDLHVFGITTHYRLEFRVPRRVDPRGTMPSILCVLTHQQLRELRHALNLRHRHTVEDTMFTRVNDSLMVTHLPRHVSVELKGTELLRFSEALCHLVEYGAYR